VPEGDWSHTRVREVMVPARELPLLAPGDDAMDAVRGLASSQTDQIAVVEDGRLRGVVRQQDIMRWIELHRGPARA
jgi:CBS domain-containing protein